MRNIRGGLNLTILAAQLAAALSGLALASHVTHFATLAGCAVGFALVMQSAYFLMHEAAHGSLHSRKAINDLGGRALSAFFPTSFSLMKAAHLSHHAHNRGDSELFDYFRPDESPSAKTVLYYLNLCGFLWMALGLLPLIVAFVPAPALSRRIARLSPARREFFGFIKKVRPWTVRVEVLSSVLLLAAAFHLLQLSLAPTLFCYLVFAFGYSSQQQIYHSRTSRHVVEGSYDLKLGRMLECLYLNANYHLQHHRRPSAPWTSLPRLADPKAARLSYGLTYLRVWAPPRPIERARA